MMTEDIAPHNIREFLKGRSQTQNNELPHHFTQSPNVATHITPYNTLTMVNKHRRDKSQNRATLSRNLLIQSQALHPNNDSKRLQQY